MPKETKPQPRLYVTVAIKKDNPTDILALHGSESWGSRLMWSRTEAHVYKASKGSKLAREFTMSLSEHIKEDVERALRDEIRYWIWDKEKYPNIEDLPKYQQKKRYFERIYRKKNKVYKWSYIFARSIPEYVCKNTHEAGLHYGKKLIHNGYVIKTFRVNSKNCPILVDMRIKPTGRHDYPYTLNPNFKFTEN